jgi:hypothetical protein
MGFVLSNPTRSFVSTIRVLLFEPTSFFHCLPPGGSLRNPLVFALRCFLISFALAVLIIPLNPLAEDVQRPDRLLARL